jgi:hypothetical protein
LKRLILIAAVSLVVTDSAMAGPTGFTQIGKCSIYDQTNQLNGLCEVFSTDMNTPAGAPVWINLGWDEAGGDCAHYYSAGFYFGCGTMDTGPTNE